MKVQIHASNVQIISLEMGDHLRANKLKEKNETTKPKEGEGAKTSKKRIKYQKNKKFQ